MIDTSIYWFVITISFLTATLIIVEVYLNHKIVFYLYIRITRRWNKNKNYYVNIILFFETILYTNYKFFYFIIKNEYLQSVRIRKYIKLLVWEKNGT